MIDCEMKSYRKGVSFLEDGFYIFSRIIEEGEVHKKREESLSLV